MTEEVDNQDKATTAEDEVESLSQGAIDQIVKRRLSRQKKEYEAIVEQLNRTIEEKEATLSQYEQQITAMVGERLVELPEPIKELVEKLPTPEKLAWLIKYAKSEDIQGFSKQQIPPTPQGNGGEKQFRPNTRGVFKI